MPEFFIEFVEWAQAPPFIGMIFMVGVILAVTLLSSMLVPGLVDIVKKSTGRELTRRAGLKTVLCLLSLLVPVLVFVTSIYAWVIANTELSEREEAHRQSLVEQETAVLEGLLEGHGPIADYEVAFTLRSSTGRLRGEEDEPPVPVVHLSEADRNAVIYDILTDPDADQFEVIHFVVLDDPEIYGPDNAAETDRFTFEPAQMDPDTLTVETVLHHGDRRET